MRVFDLHCDTVTVLAEGKEHALENGKTAITLQKAERAGMEAYAQCFALFIESDDSREAAQQWDAYYDRFCRCRTLYQDRMEQVLCSEDIARILQAGKIAAILTLENASAFGGELTRIAELRKKGCLMATLTWNGRNDLGGGAGAQDYGLSEFGCAAVREMERCGMIADISHLSDKSVQDFLNIAGKPFVASHSNSRACCNVPRNLPDEYVQEIIRRRGLIGVNFYTHFLREDCPGKAGLADLCAHVEHILALGGEDVLALGSDYDGAEVPAALDGIDRIGALYAFLQVQIGTALTEKLFFDNAARFFRACLSAEAVL